MFRTALFVAALLSLPAYAGFKDTVEDAVGYCQKAVLDHVENQRQHGITVSTEEALSLISECIVDEIPEDRDPGCSHKDDDRCYP